MVGSEGFTLEAHAGIGSSDTTYEARLVTRLGILNVLRRTE